MKKSVFIFIGIALLSSCERLTFQEKGLSDNPFVNFDYLWNEVDEKYSYFELKNIDWDSVRTVERAKLYIEMSEDSLFKVLGGMLTQLRDDHTNLISDFQISSFGVQFLSQDQYDGRIIADHYLSNPYRTGPFTHDLLRNDSIGYIRYGSFTGTITQANLNLILHRMKDTQGLILDLRENGGGAVSDVFNLLSCFVEEKTLVNYSRLRSGPNHDDFTEAEPVYVEPRDSLKYTKPVMVLVDRGTYSAGSFTSLATKALSNVMLVGDTTGGGLGLPNGGQLPNGWTYRFSVTQAMTLDLDPSYENGVPPDILVDFDWTNLEKDEIIERAIEEIL